MASAWASFAQPTETPAQSSWQATSTASKFPIRYHSDQGQNHSKRVTRTAARSKGRRSGSPSPPSRRAQQAGSSPDRQASPKRFAFYYCFLSLSIEHSLRHRRRSRLLWPPFSRACTHSSPAARQTINHHTTRPHQRTPSIRTTTGYISIQSFP